MTRQTLKKTKAFTLIEIIVVLVILSVIASFSYSKYTKFAKTQEMKHSVQNLMTIYQMARILELKTGRSLYTLLPSSQKGLTAINNFFTAQGLPLNLNDATASFTLHDSTNDALNNPCIHISVDYPTATITLENPHCLGNLYAPTPTATCSSTAGCYNLYPATN